MILRLVINSKFLVHNCTLEFSKFSDFKNKDYHGGIPKNMHKPTVVIPEQLNAYNELVAKLKRKTAFEIVRLYKKNNVSV